jgi:hypothetical protein
VAKNILDRAKKDVLGSVNGEECTEAFAEASNKKDGRQAGERALALHLILYLPPDSEKHSKVG